MMDDKLKEIFDRDTIQYLKENKDKITPELLEQLRSFGNKGKKIALEILDTVKDQEGYYVDSFNNRLSFNGNRGLKGAFSKLDLAEIHEIEIERCRNDIHYYKDNYIQIRTKDGINFPDLRVYQNEFIDVLEKDENEDILGLLPRQCCTAETLVHVEDNNQVKQMTMEELFNECKNDE